MTSSEDRTAQARQMAEWWEGQTWGDRGLRLKAEETAALLRALTAASDTAQRVPCSCGKDDADVKWAQCYNCRQRPFAQIEAAEARVAALEQALREIEALDFMKDLAGNRQPIPIRWNRAIEVARAALKGTENV